MAQLVLKRSREDAAKQLAAAIDRGERLKSTSVSNNGSFDELLSETQKWMDFTEQSLGNIFEGNEATRKFGGTVWLLTRPSASIREHADRLKKNIELKLTVLESLREMLPVIEEFISAQAVQQAPVRSKGDADPTNRVFIVHGHNEQLRSAVEAFVYGLRLEPIVLDQQISSGNTIIEKFEHYSRVDYAIVILSPDDVGAPSRSPEMLKPRARQNVIFELGYFVGRLGRRHVCVLREGDVEVPSDFQGVVYVSRDANNAWQQKMAREMREAGLPVNTDKL